MTRCAILMIWMKCVMDLKFFYLSCACFGLNIVLCRLSTHIRGIQDVLNCPGSELFQHCSRLFGCRALQSAALLSLLLDAFLAVRFDLTLPFSSGTFLVSLTFPRTLFLPCLGCCASHTLMVSAVESSLVVLARDDVLQLDTSSIAFPPTNGADRLRSW